MEDGRRSDIQQSHLSFVSTLLMLFLGSFHSSLCGYLCLGFGKGGRICIRWARAVCKT